MYTALASQPATTEWIGAGYTAGCLFVLQESDSM